MKNVDKMVLDSQALINLEVSETMDGKEGHTLYSFINQCMTQFGKREMKRWIIAPLLDVDQIN